MKSVSLVLCLMECTKNLCKNKGSFVTEINLQLDNLNHSLLMIFMVKLKNKSPIYNSQINCKPDFI